MEELPIGLNLKKKKKKNKPKVFQDNDNNINKAKEISIKILLMIQTCMNDYNYYPKTDYFIKNKNNDIFPENLIFEKVFPKFTNYFKNLDYKFSEAIESKAYKDEKNDMSEAIKKFILDQSNIWDN